MTVRGVMGLVGLCGILAMGCGGDETNGSGDGGTSGTGGTSGSGGTSGTGGSTASNCPSACEVIVPCLMETTEMCMAQCEGDLSDATDFSPACGAAVNDLAACIGGLSCAELDGWLDEIPADSYPCRAQDIAIDEC